MYTGLARDNQKPSVYLTNGPQDNDETEYIVHFYWYGDDPDGTVEYYEYAFSSGDPIGFDPADTTGLAKWTKITCTDTMFRLTADEYDTTVTINYSLYAKYHKTHTFFIRAVDDLGMRSEPVYRSFTAWTLAPFVSIKHPKEVNPGHNFQTLGPVIRFKWEGKDPIDSPWNYQEIDSVRYMCTEFSPGIVDDLNMNPGKYEHLWKPWIAYNAPGDSGLTTVLGDDEILTLLQRYIFAVQAKDEAGAVTAIFDRKTNVRDFIVREPTGPFLIVHEKFFGDSKFLGMNVQAPALFVPSGFPLRFSWEADASSYGGVVRSYRYGWDIERLDNPSDWDVDPGLEHLSAPEVRFQSGTHTFYVESVDDLGIVTLGQVEIQIFPAMERNLLWVDDLYSYDFVQHQYARPTETEHDQFWETICSRADGFDPARDVFDTSDHEFEWPSIQLLWKYKNVIWTYSSARPKWNTWYNLILFMEYKWGVGGIETNNLNILSYYLENGGHLWTLGESNNDGGMLAVAEKGLRKIPMNLRCELRGVTGGCVDTVGVNCMPYKDFCVTVVDKVYGALREDIDFMGYTNRNIQFDALAYSYKDSDDPFTAMHPDLPDDLPLWERVVQSGMFFDPRLQGFTYVEVYNPEYWMTRKGIFPQGCFHPMYRMRARNTNSVLDNTIVAFWTARHADVLADAPGAVAAPSVHFGMPLWFFEREQVNAIADVIFREWNIKAE
jgi:hypothetical protein